MLPIVRISFFGFFAVALVLRAEAALDLTATPEEYIGEGITYRRLVFKDDQGRVEMELPRGWSYRGGGAARMQLTPPGTGSAEAFIEAEALPPSPAFDEPTTKALEQQAVTAVPQESQSVTLVQTNQGIAGPDGRESLEVVVSYKILGSIFIRSTLFVNFPENRLRFRITAPEKDFEALSKTFHRAIRSWDSKQPPRQGRD